MKKENIILKVPALRVEQSPGKLLYCFAIDGKKLDSFASVSRIRRGDDTRVLGYQRPEVISHIAEIRAYIESEQPMIPNALVIAFDESVSFEAAEDSNQLAQFGTLSVPFDPGAAPHEKPGWIVDGQQRAAAIRDAKIDKFPIFVIGFIAESEDEQREQFILVNSTKPLPKGLIYELLPSISTHLPAYLARRRFPAILMDRLNRDQRSPLKDMIRTPTSPEGTIKDNSILRMLENSLSDGVLYRLGSWGASEEQTDLMLDVLFVFWQAVADTFPDAWNVSPRRSRLMHGVGIVSMGFIMDAISDRHRKKQTLAYEDFHDDLRPLEEVCRWTNGYWDFGPGIQRKWNELQNTSRDTQLLANYLLTQYKALVWSRSPNRPTVLS